MRPAALSPEAGSGERDRGRSAGSRVSTLSPEDSHSLARYRAAVTQNQANIGDFGETSQSSRSERRVNQRVAGLVRRAIWRPQRDSNPCYLRERRVS